MNPALEPIPLINLTWSIGLLLIVAYIHMKWSLKGQDIVVASARMISQLAVIGFLLNMLFENRHPLGVCAILGVMLIAATWIALRPIKEWRAKLYWRVLLAIFVGGVFTLGISVLFIVGYKPWYEPRYLIPLAGMIFSNAMNAVSLGAERFHAESLRGESYTTARAAAYRASLLPLINSFLAVGLVALPGMMTGQILAGVSPFIAIRYQIMIMSSILSAAGISSAIYLISIKNLNFRR